MPSIKVNLGSRSYPVIIGSEITDKLLLQLKKEVGSNRLFVFYDSRFYALHGSRLNKLLKKKIQVCEFVVPSGEKSKSKAMLAKLYDYLLSENISRSDFILACGGGVTSDLVGYTAATTLRGIKWGVLSTTLLGMVDASIGGKTGINHNSGKNLIGAFHQPSFVVCNTDYLNTLPDREILCGFGEILKYAGLIGQPMVDLIQKFLNSNSTIDSALMTKIIKESVRYKAEIVSKDEHEGKLRMLLNLGHTVGHAVEKTAGYGKLLHGEAVILGLLASVNLSLTYYNSKNKQLEAYKTLISEFVKYVPMRNLDIDQIVTAVGYDKKRVGQKQNFVLLKRVGQPIIVDDINKQQLKSGVTRMLKHYRENHG